MKTQQLIDKVTNLQLQDIKDAKLIRKEYFEVYREFKGIIQDCQGVLPSLDSPEAQLNKVINDKFAPYYHNIYGITKKLRPYKESPSDKKPALVSDDVAGIIGGYMPLPHNKYLFTKDEIPSILTKLISEKTSFEEEIRKSVTKADLTPQLTLNIIKSLPYLDFGVDSTYARLRKIKDLNPIEEEFKGAAALAKYSGVQGTHKFCEGIELVRNLKISSEHLELSIKVLEELKNSKKLSEEDFVNVVKSIQQTNPTNEQVKLALESHIITEDVNYLPYNIQSAQRIQSSISEKENMVELRESTSWLDSYRILEQGSKAFLKKCFGYNKEKEYANWVNKYGNNYPELGRISQEQIAKLNKGEEGAVSIFKKITLIVHPDKNEGRGDEAFQELKNIYPEFESKHAREHFENCEAEQFAKEFAEKVNKVGQTLAKVNLGSSVASFGMDMLDIASGEEVDMYSVASNTAYLSVSVGGYLNLGALEYIGGVYSKVAMPLYMYNHGQKAYVAYQEGDMLSTAGHIGAISIPVAGYLGVGSAMPLLYGALSTFSIGYTTVSVAYSTASRAYNKLGGSEKLKEVYKFCVSSFTKDIDTINSEMESVNGNVTEKSIEYTIRTETNNTAKFMEEEYDIVKVVFEREDNDVLSPEAEGCIEQSLGVMFWSEPSGPCSSI